MMAETIRICGAGRGLNKCRNEVPDGHQKCTSCTKKAERARAAAKVQKWRAATRVLGFTITTQHLQLIEQLTWEDFGLLISTSAPAAHWEFPWGPEYDIKGAVKTLGWLPDDDNGYWDQTKAGEFIMDCATWLVFETVQYALPILTANPASGAAPGLYMLGPNGWRLVDNGPGAEEAGDGK
jgi:hypothetical protein